MSLHVKKGDTVIVTTGADKGKTGKVLKSFPARSRVVVEGVNVRKRHQQPRRTDQKGQVIERPMSVHASNVSLIDPTNGKATRVSKKQAGDSFVRVSKKSGASIS